MSQDTDSTPRAVVTTVEPVNKDNTTPNDPSTTVDLTTDTEQPVTTAHSELTSALMAETSIVTTTKAQNLEITETNSTPTPTSKISTVKSFETSAATQTEMTTAGYTSIALADVTTVGTSGTVLQTSLKVSTQQSTLSEGVTTGKVTDEITRDIMSTTSEDDKVTKEEMASPTTENAETTSIYSDVSDTSDSVSNVTGWTVSYENTDFHIYTFHN